MNSKSIAFVTISIVLHLSATAEAEEAFCGNKCDADEVVSFRSCHCDELCRALYGDCCADVGTELQGRTFSRRQDVVCRSFSKNGSTFVVSGCSPDWIGPGSISDNCHQLQSGSLDPVGSTPVTSYSTGVTYANYYCAICNNDSRNITMWDLKISCPFDLNILMDEEEVMRYIFYNPEVKQWGYILQGSLTNRAAFHGCNITNNIPTSVKKITRSCYPDEISWCSPSWRNDVMRDMCRSYTDPVFNNEVRYKNFYCAVCNRVDQSQMTCGDAIGYRTHAIPDSPSADPKSFTLLLDVNLSDGNTVGKKNVPVNCGNGQRYDPFAKRCRNIVCGIPGYVMREGRCALESRS